MRIGKAALALTCGFMLAQTLQAADPPRKGTPATSPTKPPPTPPAAKPVTPPAPPAPHVPQKNCPSFVYLKGPGSYAAGPATFSGNGGFVAFNLLALDKSGACDYTRSQSPSYYGFVAAYFPAGSQCAIAKDGKGFNCTGVPSEVQCPASIGVGPATFVSFGAYGGQLQPIPPTLKAAEDQITVTFKSVEVWPKYGPSGAPAMRCNYGDWPSSKPKLL